MTWQIYPLTYKPSLNINTANEQNKFKKKNRQKQEIIITWLNASVRSDWLIFKKKLTNGKRHSVHYWVMDARGRLLNTKEALESHEAIAVSDSSFLST